MQEEGTPRRTACITGHFERAITGWVTRRRDYVVVGLRDGVRTKVRRRTCNYAKFGWIRLQMTTNLDARD